MRTKSIYFPNSLSEFEELYDKLQRVAVNKLLNTGGLAIRTGGAVNAKFANTIYVLVDGVLVTKTTANCTNLPASVLPTTGKMVFVFTIDAAGTLYTIASNLDATTLAGIVFPDIPDGQVAIGFIIVENAMVGSFTGNSTALDAVGMTVTYVNTPFAFLPELLEL